MKFIMTPVGAVLAVIVGAFLLVKNAMDRSEDSTNKITKAFSAFSGITNALRKMLVPLGEFLIDGIVKGFEEANKMFGGNLPEISYKTQERTLALIDAKIESLKNPQSKVEE